MLRKHETEKNNPAFLGPKMMGLGKPVTPGPFKHAVMFGIDMLDFWGVKPGSGQISSRPKTRVYYFSPKR